MNTADIINEILYYTRLNRNQLSKKIGVSQQTIQNYKEGKVKAFSTNFIKKLLDVYPEISYDYLVTGKGSLVEKITESNTVVGTGNNTAANNHNSTININTELAKETIEVLKGQLVEKDTQIRDLLTIIKDLSKKNQKP